MKPNVSDKIEVSIQLVCEFFSHWLNNKPPKYLLIASIMGCGYLAKECLALPAEVWRWAIPSVQVITSGHPEWPLVVVLWSFVLLVVAEGLMLRRVALEAAFQLHRRFGIKQAP